MLRVSKITDYGTLVMSQMACAPSQVFSANDLAGRLGLGVATVSKILKILARHELVVSVRGQRGGYSLSLPPEPSAVRTRASAASRPAAACRRTGGGSTRWCVALWSP